MIRTTADLASLTADQLAEKVFAGLGDDYHMLAKDEQPEPFLAELVRRAKERDIAVETIQGSIRTEQELRVALRAAEARLAETQEALEEIAAIETDGFRVTLAEDDPGLTADKQMQAIARAALTTHHAEAKPWKLEETMKEAGDP